MHLVAVLYHTGQFDVLNAILCQWRSFLSVVYVLDCSLCILLYCTDFVLYLARVTFPTLNYDGAKYEVLEINVGNCEPFNDYVANRLNNTQEDQNCTNVAPGSTCALLCEPSYTPDVFDSPNPTNNTFACSGNIDAPGTWYGDVECNGACAHLGAC